MQTSFAASGLATTKLLYDAPGEFPAPKKSVREMDPKTALWLVGVEMVDHPRVAKAFAGVAELASTYVGSKNVVTLFEALHVVSIVDAFMKGSREDAHPNASASVSAFFDELEAIRQALEIA